MKRLIGRLLVLLALAACVAGCAGQGSIMGTVTFRPTGKKLAWGTVTVVGADGIPRQGMINKDGTYTVNGVPAGAARVTVSSENPKPVGDAPERGRDPGPGKPTNAPEAATGGAVAVPEDIVKAWFPIPAKYADLAQSGLKVQVQAGVNAHDIVLD